MSKLAQGNGDDFPDAARKHLQDARVLLPGARFDGCAYLAGYVVECALKALIQLEKGYAAVPKGKKGHDIPSLHAIVSPMFMLAGAKISKYLTMTVRKLPSLGVTAWDPSMRYRIPSVTQAAAQSWLADAETIYNDTVVAMRLDGLI